MSVELSLLKCFCDSREMYDKYYPYLKDLDNMDRDIKLLFRLVDQFYTTYEQDKIGRDDLTALYDHLYTTSKNRSFHVELIKAMYEIDINPELTQDMLEKMMERHYATKAMNLLHPVLEGNKWGVLPDIRSLVDEFVRKMKYPPPEVRALTPHSMTVEELLSKEVNPDGLSWPLDELNESIGVVRPQTFGIEYAYPDSGKTSFMCRCVAHWAQQIDDDEVIVIAGNEEASSRTDLRITQSLLNWTKDQMAADPHRIHETRIARGYNRIKIFDSVHHVDNVIRLLEEYNPTVMAIDQVTKLGVDIKSTSDVKQIEAVANWCRERAKEFNCMIMGTTQGSGESLNKKWLELNDIYNTKIALQGEIDFGIGIGRDTKDPTKENWRFISIPKNKFGSHNKFAVIFEQANNIWRPL